MYITQSDLQNFILQDIDSSYTAWINTVIDFVEDYIDAYCLTDFAGGNAGEVRYFDGSGLDRIYIGNFRAISAVDILQPDGNVQISLTENIDYYTFPFNQTVKSQLVLNRGAAKLARFPSHDRALRVTGTWGWGTANVPPQIKLAAIKLAAKIINEGLRGGQVSGETLGSHRVDYRQVDEEAEAMGIKDILNTFRPVLLD